MPPAFIYNRLGKQNWTFCIKLHSQLEIYKSFLSLGSWLCCWGRLRRASLFLCADLNQLDFPVNFYGHFYGHLFHFLLPSSLCSRTSYPTKTEPPPELLPPARHGQLLVVITAILVSILISLLVFFILLIRFCACECEAIFMFIRGLRWWGAKKFWKFPHILRSQKGQRSQIYFLNFFSFRSWWNFFNLLYS